MNAPIVIFTLAGRRLALPAASVRECLPLPVLDRRPGSPPALAGFFVLGGDTVPAIDLAVLLGLRAPDAIPDAPLGAAPDADPLYRPLLLLREAALLVDRLEQVRLPDGANERPESDPWQNGCVSRHLLADGPVALLDPDRLLLEEERARLAVLTAQARQRERAWMPDGAVVVD